jgi:3-deoxy-D-manno-octulosonic-acid transferase
VLVADTLGELVFWYAVADSIYLGGATAAEVGGHNAIEAAHLGRRVFTGPHGFNFRDVFAQLKGAGALVIGDSALGLSSYWLTELTGAVPVDAARLRAVLAEGDAPFAETVAVLQRMVPPYGK